jgi:hypothetical protein
MPDGSAPCVDRRSLLGTRSKSLIERFERIYVGILDPECPRRCVGGWTLKHRCSFTLVELITSIEVSQWPASSAGGPDRVLSVQVNRNPLDVWS